jgi:hypothetical protein
MTDLEAVDDGVAVALNGLRVGVNHFAQRVERHVTARTHPTKTRPKAIKTIK